MYFATIAGQCQLGYMGQSGEVSEVRVQRLGLADERDDFRIDVKRFHVSGRAIDGGGYSFAPQLEIGIFGEMKLLEEVGTAPNGPSFADGRVGLENVVLELCMVYDIVEDFLRESWRHGVGRV